MFAFFFEINNEKRMCVFRVEIVVERIFAFITIENDHENQKDFFFNNFRKINRID